MTAGDLKKLGAGGQMTRDQGFATAAVAASGTNSAAVNTGLAAWGTFQMPASITGTECSFEYSNNNSNWTAVPQEGTEPATFTIAANGTYRIPAAAFKAAYFRVVMATAQAAAITITFFLKS